MISNDVNLKHTVMTIKQISIFLENKYGKLSEILHILSEAHIGIVAATVADTSEYGILRLIVTDADQALKVLKENNVTVNPTEVLAIATDGCACSFSNVMDFFTEAGISIEYMYCFSIDKKAILILRTNNPSDAYEVVRKHQLEYITADKLKMI